MENLIKQGLRSLLTAVFVMLLLYLTIWNGVSFVEYDFVFDDNYAIRALQILHMIVWGAVFCFSPLVPLGGGLLFHGAISKRLIP